jgi:outer membrane protein assembly factor BamB
MARRFALTLGLLLATSQAHAAYRGQVVVAAGPFFNAAPIVSGEGTDVRIRNDLNIEDLKSHLAAPGGVSVVRGPDADRVYVADVFTIREINSATGTIKNVLPLSSGDFYPTTVTTTKIEDREIVVAASWISGRVQFIDAASGQVLRDEGNFSQPYDVVALSNGTVIVAETARLVAIATDGTRQVFAEGFQKPMGLALAADNTLYFTDRSAGTLTTINTDTLARQIVADRLAAPEGVAILPDGLVAVVETGTRRIITIDSNGKRANLATNLAIGNEAATAFTPKLGQPADARLFNGLAVGSDGNVYLTSDIQTVLYVLTPGGGPSSFRAMIRSLTSIVFR